MKDYSKMSDFEINKAVAINRCGYQGHVEHMERGVKESDRDSNGMFYFERDYCNNPSDAWPIMVESNIATRPLYVRDNKGRKIVEWEAKFTERDFPRNTIGWDDQNPLRAAMIVYLMMKDEEK